MEDLVTAAPAVSVIMNCYNSAAYLAEAIDSVYAQTFTDWEIIFWDNASTDASPRIAQGYDGRLRYFRSPETGSLGQARNLALAQARGKYISFLDCDDLFFPERLSRQVAMFEARPELGLIFSNIEFISKGKPPFLAFSRHCPPEGMVFGALIRYYFLPLPAVMLCRAVLGGQAQWFDPRFSIAEEADLFMRIAHDHPIGYCPEVLAKARLHPGSLTERRPDMVLREEELMLEKFRDLWPGFEQKYHAEISHRRECVNCFRGILEWQKGDAAAARKRFAPYLKRSPRRWVMYLMSYLPYPVYGFLKDGFKMLAQPFNGKFGWS